MLSRPLKGLLSALGKPLKLAARADPSRGCSREAASSRSLVWHALHPARELEDATVASTQNPKHATFVVRISALPR